jgi:hypothetical protein
MNKRGDAISLLYIIVFLFVVGTLIFLISHIGGRIFTELDIQLNDSSRNTTYTSEVLGDAMRVNTTAWDYAFLGIFLGSMMVLGLTAYAVRVSPVFYWIYAILSMMFLGIAVLCSNVWQELAADTEFATTITNFPITNLLLGTYYPIIITGVILFAMVILFGKPTLRQQEQQGGFY